MYILNMDSNIISQQQFKPKNWVIIDQIVNTFGVNYFNWKNVKQNVSKVIEDISATPFFSILFEKVDFASFDSRIDSNFLDPIMVDLF